MSHEVAGPTALRPGDDLPRGLVPVCRQTPLCSLITGRRFWGASRPLSPASYGSDSVRVVITARAGRPVLLLCRVPSLMPLDSIRGWLCGCGARGHRGRPLPSAECQAISPESPSSQSWGPVSSGNMPQGSAEAAGPGTAGPTLCSLLSTRQAPCSAAAPGGPCLVPGACPGLRIPGRCPGRTAVSPSSPSSAAA